MIVEGIVQGAKEEFVYILGLETKGFLIKEQGPLMQRETKTCNCCCAESDDQTQAKEDQATYISNINGLQG